MNDKEIAREHYLTAKAYFKMDLRIWLIFLSISSLICSIFFICSSGNKILSVENIIISGILGITTGLLLTCAPIGLKTVFGFAFKVLSGLSYASLFIMVIVFVVLFGVSILYGPVITIIKFILGYVRIRKLRKMVN